MRYFIVQKERRGRMELYTPPSQQPVNFLDPFDFKFDNTFLAKNVPMNIVDKECEDRTKLMPSTSRATSNSVGELGNYMQEDLHFMARNNTVSNVVSEGVSPEKEDSQVLGGSSPVLRFYHQLNLNPLAKEFSPSVTRCSSDGVNGAVKQLASNNNAMKQPARDQNAMKQSASDHDAMKQPASNNNAEKWPTSDQNAIEQPATVHCAVKQPDSAHCEVKQPNLCFNNLLMVANTMTGAAAPNIQEISSKEAPSSAWSRIPKQLQLFQLQRDLNPGAKEFIPSVPKCLYDSAHCAVKQPVNDHNAMKQPISDDWEEKQPDLCSEPHLTVENRVDVPNIEDISPKEDSTRRWLRRPTELQFFHRHSGLNANAIVFTPSLARCSCNTARCARKQHCGDLCAVKKRTSDYSAVKKHIRDRYTVKKCSKNHCAVKNSVSDHNAMKQQESNNSAVQQHDSLHHAVDQHDNAHCAVNQSPCSHCEVKVPHEAVKQHKNAQNAVKNSDMSANIEFTVANNVTNGMVPERHDAYPREDSSRVLIRSSTPLQLLNHQSNLNPGATEFAPSAARYSSVLQVNNIIRDHNAAKRPYSLENAETQSDSDDCALKQPDRDDCALKQPDSNDSETKLPMKIPVAEPNSIPVSAIACQSSDVAASSDHVLSPDYTSHLSSVEMFMSMLVVHHILHPPREPSADLPVCSRTSESLTNILSRCENQLGSTDENISNDDNTETNISLTNSAVSGIDSNYLEHCEADSLPGSLTDQNNTYIISNQEDLQSMPEGESNVETEDQILSQDIADGYSRNLGSEEHVYQQLPEEEHLLSPTWYDDSCIQESVRSNLVPDIEQASLLISISRDQEEHDREQVMNSNELAAAQSLSDLLSSTFEQQHLFSSEYQSALPSGNMNPVGFATEDNDPYDGEQVMSSNPLADALSLSNLLSSTSAQQYLFGNELLPTIPSENVNLAGFGTATNDPWSLRDASALFPNMANGRGNATFTMSDPFISSQPPFHTSMNYPQDTTHGRNSEIAADNIMAPNIAPQGNQYNTLAMSDPFTFLQPPLCTSSMNSLQDTTPSSNNELNILASNGATFSKAPGYERQRRRQMQQAANNERCPAQDVPLLDILRQQAADKETLRHCQQQLRDNMLLVAEMKRDIRNLQTRVEVAETSADMWKEEANYLILENSTINVINQVQMSDLNTQMESEMRKTTDSQLQILNLKKMVTMNKIDMNILEASWQIKQLSRSTSQTSESIPNDLHRKCEELNSNITSCNNLKIQVELAAQRLTEDLQRGLNIDMSVMEISLPDISISNEQSGDEHMVNTNIGMVNPNTGHQLQPNIYPVYPILELPAHPNIQQYDISSNIGHQLPSASQTLTDQQWMSSMEQWIFPSYSESFP